MDRSAPIEANPNSPIQQLKRYPGKRVIAWLTALIGWLLVLIATPIGLWTVAGDIFPFLASLGVLAQLGATLSALSLGWQARRILATGVVVIGITWLVEIIGVRFAIPFGRYTYSAALQPQVGGTPALIPLAWLMMLAPAWGATQAILGSQKARLKGWYWLAFSSLAGIIFTAWDLYLDPQMVQRGLWVWEETGNPSFFGIPWSNYGGWWLTATLITWIIRPNDLPVQPLLVIYSLTWIFQVIGLGVFWGQPGPALAGFVGMGIPTLLAWRTTWREAER